MAVMPLFLSCVMLPCLHRVSAGIGIIKIIVCPRISVHKPGGSIPGIIHIVQLVAGVVVREVVQDGAEHTLAVEAKDVSIKVVAEHLPQLGVNPGL